MTFKIPLFIFTILVASFVGNSQYQINWQGDLSLIDTNWIQKKDFHTAIYPHNNQVTNSVGFQIGKHTQILPLTDIATRFDEKLFYRIGIGFALESNKNKIFYYRIGGVFGYQTKDSLFQSAGISINQNIFVLPAFRMGFKANKYFESQVGYDKNFIGDGCRSLLISDYGKAFPFIKLIAKFWHINYSINYQFLEENYKNKNRFKFSSTHYVSWNATRWWNFGVFESVLFQPKDTLLFRGFDAEYLNPMVFFRPQEYSIGSSDNVLLGLNTNFKWNKNMVYGQIMIDDFWFAELFHKRGWWGNKIGCQLGWKQYFFFKDWLIKSNYELNAIRPYTYSHVNPMANYGNLGQPLAHPRGANNCEILADFKVTKSNYYFNLFINTGYFGLNTNNLNYGSNIYLSYNNRPSDYHLQIGEGIRNYFVVLNLHAAYKLVNEGNIYAFAETQFRYDSAVQGAKFKLIPTIGIRSYLWNDYRNY